jgi:hypothetical protein
VEGGVMDNKEKLHLEAAAYATKEAKERQEQRTINNIPKYDVLLEPDYWLDASHDDGDIIANDVKMKGEFFTRFHTTPLYMQKEKNHG